MITGVMTVVTPALAQCENAVYVSPQGSDEADGSGRELTATISVTVKQGLRNNIIAFFRKLFRMNSVTI